MPTTQSKPVGLALTPDMLRAWLMGHKSNTRRVLARSNAYCDLAPITSLDLSRAEPHDDHFIAPQKDGPYKFAVRPRLKPDQAVYIKEALVRGEDGLAYYRQDRAPVSVDGRRLVWPWRVRVLAGRYMPRACARFISWITSTRAQLLQQISNQDAWDEGCRIYPDDGVYWSLDPGGPIPLADTPRDEFQALWNSINDRRGHGWDANPPVWAHGLTPPPDAQRIAL